MVIIKGDVKPIIPEKQFDRVQVLIRQRQFTRPKRYGVIYLLSGLLRCKECSGALCGHTQRKPKSGKTYSTYRCHHHLNKGNRICLGVTVKKAKLEQEVLEEIRKFAHFHFEESEANEVLAKDETNDSVEDLKAIDMAIIRLKGKQQKLLTLFEDSSIGKDLLVERMNRIIEELDRLQVKQANLVAETSPREKTKRVSLLEKVKELNDDLFSQSDKIKRSILQQLLKQVIVAKDGSIEIEMYEL
ncbi:MAG: zinc ribbon domain-containing protein [Candidatus Omnitrophica bacterium]|nr:zinc ribbon domain-containing protein [Candidatus Omnitrophota bacterium]